MFGHFDLEVTGRHVVGLEVVDDRLAKIDVSQVPGCDVDGDTAKVGPQPSTPGPGLFYGVGEHHLVYGDQ